MFQYFSGGSVLPGGFSVTGKAPVDTKYIVTTVASLSSSAVKDVSYDGMPVFCLENRTKYTFNESLDVFEPESTPSGGFTYRGVYNAKIDATNNGTVGQTNPFLHVGDSVNISGAANNGSGLIRITAVGHGLSTGNKILIENVGGTTEANGEFEVTVIDSDNIDLVGSSFSNTYTSGGTVKEIGDRFEAADGHYWRVSESYSESVVNAAASAITSINGYATGSDAASLTYQQLLDAGLTFSADASGQLSTFRTAIEGESSITTIAALKAVIDGVITGGITTTSQDRRNRDIDGIDSYGAGDWLVVKIEDSVKTISRIKTSDQIDSTVNADNVVNLETFVKNLMFTKNLKEHSANGVEYSQGEIVKKTEEYWDEFLSPAKRLSNIILVNGGNSQLIIENHGFSVGDIIRLDNVSGTTTINNIDLEVMSIIDANTISVDFDGAGASGYTGGGRVLTKYTGFTVYQAKQNIASGGNQLPIDGNVENVSWRLLSSTIPSRINTMHKIDNSAAAAGSQNADGEYLTGIGVLLDANEIMKRISNSLSGVSVIDGGDLG